MDAEIGIMAAVLWTDAPLWVWLAVVGASAALSVVGLAISRWFHRRRARAEGD